jgi:gas vesicle protein
MRDDGQTGSIFLAFLLGGIVGAGLALLLAPKTGRDMRRQIRELAEETRERASEYVDQTREKVTSSMEKGKEFYEEQKSAIKSALEAGKEAYEREKERHIKADA